MVNGRALIGLFLTLLLAAGAITWHLVSRHDSKMTPHAKFRVVARPVRHVARTPKLIKPPEAPSVYAQEQALGPQRLMARWDGLIAEAARRFHFPAPYIRAAMRMESGGRTMLSEGKPITSKAGAMGIMQVMPETYRAMAASYGLGPDPYNPHDSIIAGTALLKILYARYGYPEMFAAYNAGPATLQAAQSGARTLPTETIAYLGGINRILNGAVGSGVKATLTRPDGSPVGVDVGAITAIRAPLPGEYADGVQSVISIGRMHQGVRETVARATAIIRAHGGTI